MRKFTALFITLSTFLGHLEAQKSVIWGIDAQIRNFGFDFGVSKTNLLKGRDWSETSGLKIGNLVDPKEVEIISQFLPGAQPFKLNKVNYAWAIKPFFSKSFHLAQRRSRLDIGCKLTGAVSLPVVYSWPIYIWYYNGTPPFDGYQDMRYDPKVHNPALIGGTTAFTKGMKQGQFIPGLGLSGAIQFDWGSYKSISNSVSLGVSLDGFVQKIPLLYTQETNRNIFPALFINFAFGFGDIQ